jgi:hypothetical protein
MEREYDGNIVPNTNGARSTPREPRLATWWKSEAQIQLMEEKKEERLDDEFRYLFYLYYFRTQFYI